MLDWLGDAWGCSFSIVHATPAVQLPASCERGPEAPSLFQSSAAEPIATVAQNASKRPAKPLAVVLGKPHCTGELQRHMVLRAQSASKVFLIEVTVLPQVSNRTTACGISSQRPRRPGNAGCGFFPDRALNPSGFCWLLKLL